MIYNIDLENAEIDIDGGRLIVRQNGVRRATLPIKQMERLVIASSSTITSRSFSAIAAEGTGCLFLGGRFGREPVHILPHRGDTAKRFAQVLLAEKETLRADYGQNLVNLKLSSQKGLLKNLKQNLIVKAAINRIEVSMRRLEVSHFALDSLQGIEGAAAAAYFEAYQTVLLKSK